MSSKPILVLAEHDNEVLKKVTYQVITAATQLSEEITLLVVGQACDKVAEAARHIAGLKRIWIVDDLAFQQGLAENMAALIAEIGKVFSYILAPATTYGKNILPRAAALLGVAQISEITQIISADTFVRPIYAGNVQATVQSLDDIKVITVRPTAFEPAGTHQHSIPIEKIVRACGCQLSSLIAIQNVLSKRPELGAARIVVAGGRGLLSAENFKLLEDIADKLGAAVGASRAAVDAGFIANNYQIGQTGKVVAPDLYIAVGISGAIQHVAGMKESKVIVAINKDADAPIFQIADYGLIGDLFQILPALDQELASQIDKK